jgi:Nif-specific regulatory protein
MAVNPIATISGIAVKLAEADGLRDGTSAVANDLVEALSARFAFVIGLQEDGDMPDVLAATGLGVADFRRLESRIAKSSLWKIVNLKKPMAIDDLARDTVLNFLAFGTAARMLIAVPVVLRDACFGFLAVGFLPGSEPNEGRTIGILSAVAAMTAQAIRVERALSRESQQLAEENVHLRQELKEKYDIRRLVGNSSPMRQVYDRVSHVARSNATVLLRGESGTGKELMAGTIHYNSLRSKRRFIKINCGAFAPELVDGELFGHDRGSADGVKKGRIESADGGTLFLDEIGALPVSTQLRLLRLVDERRFERLGRSDPIDRWPRAALARSFFIGSAHFPYSFRRFAIANPIFFY